MNRSFPTLYVDVCARTLQSKKRERARKPELTWKPGDQLKSLGKYTSWAEEKKFEYKSDE